MRYWDSSALVPLVVDEPGGKLVRRLLAEDDRVVTWALSHVEIAGAVERRARQGMIDPAGRRRALERFDRLASRWDEVIDLLPVRRLALSLLARHALRSADALQLAAAHQLVEGEPASVSFVCLDKALADAAGREGFAVLGWPR